ncbi:MAG: tRNA epoxyqueuosine(34) reductase QueG [Bacteroidales bacterium]|jgi:epoxyqueuosine reductase|nr:tRNA epoxyqueuosine(34) reductase QueG [Bacteroidales bacterium]
MHYQCSISQKIKIKAKELGFLDCAIIPASELSEEGKHLKTWLKNNMHGQLEYMARNVDKRLNPKLLVENVKSIIVVILNYYTGQTQTGRETPVISKYAYGTDYHFVMKDKMKKLLLFIQTEIKPCNARVFTDSAPILERTWAHRAGLGWIGKNTNLISVKHGSFFFIGELFLDVEFPYEKHNPVNDHCGNCTRCIDACPTKAILVNRVIDVRKCISYQTIEVKGIIDEKLKGQFANRIFGCDICQDVCPWNLKSKPHNEPYFEPHPYLLQLSKNDWHKITQPLFNTLFKNSAVQRIGFNGLKRNLQFIQSE